jgi:phage-related protein
MPPAPEFGFVFFRQSGSEVEPVRVWLKSLSPMDRRVIGEDLLVLQYRWPIGMPLVRKLDSNLWELRSRLVGGIARVFFTTDGQIIIARHGSIKKSQKTPDHELTTARKRLAEYQKASP